MANLSVRNRNLGKFDKNGKKKAPNWEYRFDGAKVDGKRQQISKSGFNTKSEAQIEGNKAFTQYNNAGKLFEASSISVSDYMTYWLDNYCKMNVADSTYVGYKNIINKYIRPNIGNYKLCSITTMHLQELINSLYTSNNFSKGYLKNMIKVIKGSFKYAKITAKLISVDPACDIVIPKVDSKNNEDKGIIVLSKHEVSCILERFIKSPYQYYALLTAYYTGFRVSEVYGLTWDCVDFENSTITVNKSAKKIEKQGTTENGKRKRGIRGKAATKWYLGSCKTESSYRSIKVGDTLINALKEYKQYQEEKEQLYGEFYIRQYVKDEITETHRPVKRMIPLAADISTDYERIYPVFIKENGEFHGSDSVKYVSKVINNELEIDFNFHALRHTHATMLIEAGIPVKTVSERLGHGSTRTTLETYVHVTDSMKDKAVYVFEKFGELPQ